MFVALLNIVSSIVEQGVDLENVAPISTLLCERIKEETDRYAKSTGIEILARLASMGDQQALKTSLNLLRTERWSAAEVAA